MHDYKTEMMEERHEEELRPFIAKSLGITVKRLVAHPYERDEWTLRWLDNGPPKGVAAPGGITDIDPPKD